MGCLFSGLNALYDAVNGGGDVWISENRFRILRQLGEGGFAYVFLVKEVISDSSNPGISKTIKDSSHVSGVISSKNVNGNGIELSNPSSKASSASIPRILRGEGEILQSSNLKSFAFSDHMYCTNTSTSTSTSTSRQCMYCFLQLELQWNSQVGREDQICTTRL
ncbi:uncharacterized protein LOC111393159 [Olea europaea var. sylvestris]|uniref:Probable serine threonine- kinase DDB_G0291350 n=1 Tax=Olea europaea subsp. europaea TaxID=158383 RepID=A0A8S0UKD6_OLEEU|nr:uncharacterized protein LOC111393159 [Olea europaea var. sylvestris]CAA3018659.1 probable serine threonine- kinase DDB_G0291350 [Olea europaea subsp. europaea]